MCVCVCVCVCVCIYFCGLKVRFCIFFKTIFFTQITIFFSKIPSNIDHKNLCFPFVQINAQLTGCLSGPGQLFLPAGRL